MPSILPIKELKNTSRISELAHSRHEPIFVTKNGYGDMVLMSIETYERSFLGRELVTLLETSEDDVAAGRLTDAFDSMERLRRQYGL